MTASDAHRQLGATITRLEDAIAEHDALIEAQQMRYIRRIKATQIIQRQIIAMLAGVFIAIIIGVAVNSAFTDHNAARLEAEQP